MNSRLRLISLVGVAALAALAITLPLIAQDPPRLPHHRYKLTQIGTFGGPNNTWASGPGFANENYLNHAGATVGVADTDTTDPFYPNCWYDCYVGHAFTFQNGTLTDLGTLPGTNSSWSSGLNDSGLVVGFSENGLVDPATGYPEYHGVTWTNGAISDLGTLGGSVSAAIAVNESGQVVGFATNSISDQYSTSLGPCTTQNCWPVTTQIRAVLWQGGQMQDLGTLGTGNDAVAYLVNASGQIAGVSYTNMTPNPTTGFPTQDGFLWSSGQMTDLGTLGGTVSRVFGLNNRGQVVGRSNIAGDQMFHAFIWDRGVLTDLGTLGGPNSDAFAIADSGVVAGTSGTTVPNTPHAFIWRNGTMTDLGTLPGDTVSFSLDVNSSGTVVGDSCDSRACNTERAFIWENGSMVDLNALVTAGAPTDLTLLYAYAIADSGEILAQAQFVNGDTRIVVLTPTGDCDSNCEQRIIESQNRLPAVQFGRGIRSPRFGKSANRHGGF